MSTVAAAPLRLVAFGDVEGSVWGAAMDAGEPAIVFGAASGERSRAGARAQLASVEGDRWHLTRTGFDLWSAHPAARAATRATADTADPAAGLDEAARRPAPAPGDELCAITGTITVAGSEHAIDCPGTRSTDPDFERDGWTRCVRWRAGSAPTAG